MKKENKDRTGKITAESLTIDKLLEMRYNMGLKILKNKKRLYKVVVQLFLLVSLIGIVELGLPLYLKANTQKIAEIHGISIYIADEDCKQDIIHIMDTCMSQIKDKGIQHDFRGNIIFCVDEK